MPDASMVSVPTTPTRIVESTNAEFDVARTRETLALRREQLQQIYAPSPQRFELQQEVQSLAHRLVFHEQRTLSYMQQKEIQFRTVAHEFEQQARDVTQAEVAQSVV